MLRTMSCYLVVDFDVIKTALLNTVIGMGTVFIVLILISLIIGLFGYIPKLFGGNKKAEKIVETPNVIAAEEAAVGVNEEELIDDTELVAVITAAILASMGEEAPADGLIVRSIRRTNRKKFA